VALPLNRRVGILEGGNDAPDSGGHEGIGTRGGAPMMRTGLQRHIDRRPFGRLGAVRQGVRLGVGLARACVPALPDHPVAAGDDAADHGVRAGRVTAVGRELERAAHVLHFADRDGLYPERRGLAGSLAHSVCSPPPGTG